MSNKIEKNWDLPKVDFAQEEIKFHNFVVNFIQGASQSLYETGESVAATYFNDMPLKEARAAAHEIVDAYKVRQQKISVEVMKNFTDGNFGKGLVVVISVPKDAPKDVPRGAPMAVTVGGINPEAKPKGKN